jgi:hypothetical protein
MQLHLGAAETAISSYYKYFSRYPGPARLQNITCAWASTQKAIAASTRNELIAKK